MTAITAGLINRAYLIVLLVLSILVSQPVQIGIAIAVLAIQLYSVYKQPRAGLNLVLVLASIILAPLALAGFAGDSLAVLLVLPALMLLDLALKDFALIQAFSFTRVGRSVSETFKRVGIALFLVFMVAVVAWNLTLALTSVLVIGYLSVLTIYINRKVPKLALETDKSWSRLVAGDSESMTFRVKSKARMPILVSLQTTNPWASVEPSNFILSAKGEVEATLRFTPPLAGPSKLEVQASFCDSRRLLQTGHILQPLDLHIIPRAKYAAWLANKYLEQTSAGGGMAIAVPRSTSLATKRGVEFYGSRPYQVGDRLKDIDWKHTFKLDELIVKEFSGAQGQVGIIVADLTTKNAEETDRLAYNLVMSALTLATEALPSALAVYNKEAVLLVTQPMNPRETLKKALAVTEEIVIFDSKMKVLQPSDLRRRKRFITQLGQVNTEPAQKLSQMLELELYASEQAAKAHPATMALAKAVKYLPGPAVITVASTLDDDSDALLISLEQLKDKGFKVVTVGSTRKW